MAEAPDRTEHNTGHDAGEMPRHPIISLDGQVLLDGTSRLLSLFDRGFTLGDGLFETMKVAKGEVWYLERHLRRLAHGASRLGITMPPELRQWIDNMVQRGGMAGESVYAIRITLTRGVAHGHGLAGTDVSSPTVAITTCLLPATPQMFYERGLHAYLSPVRRYERGATTGLKSTNYLESVLMIREAVAAGYHEAIFLDTRGFVSEASASNIFLWDGEVLSTPSESCGILPGVTRSVVLELARDAGIPVTEREIPLEALYRAEEMFLTSSLREIVPVTHVGELPIGQGVPGPHTRRMAAWYGAATERR